LSTTNLSTEVMNMAKKRKSPTRGRRRPHEYDHEYGLRRKNPIKAKPKRPAKKRWRWERRPARDPEVFPGRD